MARIATEQRHRRRVMALLGVLALVLQAALPIAAHTVAAATKHGTQWVHAHHASHAHDGAHAAHGPTNDAGAQDGGGHGHHGDTALHECPVCNLVKSVSVLAPPHGPVPHLEPTAGPVFGPAARAVATHPRDYSHAPPRAPPLLS